MSDWMEEMGLHHFGFTDDQIAKIDAVIPKAAVVLQWAKDHRTILNELADVGEMIFTQLAKFQKEQS